MVAGSTRHGVDGRVHRRAQKPFQGRADLQGPFRIVGLRVSHAARYRMFRTRPVSRMRAGHEALARAVLQIHSDFFMAVYGAGRCTRSWSAQGRDPAGVGRDRVMNIMRGLGIRGVRRGKTPVTTNPPRARAAGRIRWTGGSRLVRRTACTWPTSPTCAWPTARSATRRSPTACTPVGSWDGRAP